MKKIFTFFAIMCLGLGMLMAQNNYRVVENGFDKVVVHFNAGNISTMDVTTDDGAFSRITMDD